ncbi:hypothetical protein TGP89_262110 [Toxoplasma gondii p89]|uniref:Transmembrane protein n=1 Tax=Toxoplasma gondii p89 TaxID=943119 RepID=A0A086K4Z9_TOXGO|nr:hypothetical protein TGP89_262110 [Toxoplasma gondii p89]
MVIPVNHRLSSCALGMVLALLGVSSYSVWASQQDGSGNFVPEYPPLAVLEAMIQPDLTDVETEILPDSVEAAGATPGLSGVDSLRMRESGSTEDVTDSSLPGDSDGVPTIKSLAVVDSDSQRTADGYGPSPATPLQLLKRRGPAFGESQHVWSNGSNTATGISPGYATDDQNVPVAPPHHRPVVYDPRVVMVADRNYIKQIAAMERQSRDYNKLVKKATRSGTPSHHRKRYGVGVGVYSDPVSGIPWWMKPEHNGTSQEQAHDVGDGGRAHSAGLPEYAEDGEMEERRLQPRFRIFSQALGSPKKARGDRHESGEPVAWSTRNERDRDPFGFAFFRSKQEKEVRNSKDAREGRTEPRDSRRPKEDTRHMKHEPPPSPKRHQAPRSSAPHPKSAVQAEALDDDDFDDYEEFDDDFDEYEEIRPQRAQQYAGSARRRNAQSYGIYIPEVYDRPLLVSASSVETRETPHSASDSIASAASLPFGVPITKADIDFSQFFGDDHQGPSADNAKGIGKKLLFLRRKQGTAAEEDAVASLSLTHLNSEAPSSQEVKKGTLLERLKTLQDLPHADEKQKPDLTEILGSSSWHAFDQTKTKGEFPQHKQKHGEKRTPLRDNRAKTKDGQTQ